ncbi:hypothetical protein ACFLZJ_00280 [Nanoarchaeota archaeon]
MTYMKKRHGVIIFIIYLIFGLYLLNSPFQFIEIPETFSSFNNWILFVSGILVIIGGINYLRLGRLKY